LGGNEFALLHPVKDDSDAYQHALTIKNTIEKTRFVWNEKSFELSTIITMTVFDHTCNHILELIRGAESAAEISKASGHTAIKTYNLEDEQLIERDSIMSWVARINAALDQEQLKLRCQMITPADSSNENLKPHYEILLTVLDEDGGHLMPADFIMAAEEYGRMAAVDRWIITKVLKWMCDNNDVLGEIGGFSINLSGHSMNDDSFLDFIFEKLVEYDVPREKLVFEVTETTAVANLEDAADFINEMKDIGCRFSLDDFGTGQSSYAYLKSLPVDFIKIDGAFVKNIASDDVDYAMVKSITDMGHYLNKLIVAEYVTDQKVMELVTAIGVDYLQGFHFGPPVMLDDLRSLCEACLESEAAIH